MNIENVFMGVVHKILADMPLEAPIPSSGGAVVDVANNEEAKSGGCSCWLSIFMYHTPFYVISKNKRMKFKNISSSSKKP